MVWVQKAVGGGDSEGDSSDSDSDDEEKDDDRDIQEEEDGVIADADADVSTSTSATDDINADSNSNVDPRIHNNNWSFDQLYLTNEIASKNKLLLHLCTPKKEKKLNIIKYVLKLFHYPTIPLSIANDIHPTQRK